MSEGKQHMPFCKICGHHHSGVAHIWPGTKEAKAVAKADAAAGPAKKKAKVGKRAKK